MTVVTFALNLSRDKYSRIVRKSANISTIKDRIEDLAKPWYKKSLDKNLEIDKFVKRSWYLLH